MDPKLKKAYKDSLESLTKAKEALSWKRNEEDRRYIISKIGEDLVKILVPLLDNIVSSSRITREEMKEIIGQIKVESPTVNVAPTQVKVDAKVPEVRVPEIKFPTKELISVFIKAVNNIKFPQQDKVEIPKFPKEMKVEKMGQLLKSIEKLANAKMKIDMGGIDRDHPLPVILTDEDGVFYKAVMTAISSGGGSGGRQIRATGSSIHEVSLTNVANWYSFDIPDNTIALDMFLTAQGYTSYYCWEIGGKRIPIFGGYSRHISGIQFNKRKIYFTCPTASQTMVIEAFMGK